MYRYGLIGNCNLSALISHDGSIEWLCLPRPDSDPVFGSLLDPEGGTFALGLVDPDSARSTQYYRENTNILVTELRNATGAIRITDFSPRFEQYGRMFRPSMVFRIVEPIEGAPSIRASCSPVSGWDKEPVKAVRGNSHLRYEIRGDCLRVATNMPLTYFEEGVPFQLKEKLYFGLSWGVGIEDDLPSVAERFLHNTDVYWQTWVKHCSIPTLFQDETIRSALTLKLHCYEDTGAILAATTTSLPEEIGRNRNWDYRFCWLRDAFFVLSAFRNLGHFEEMEGFLKFFLNVVHQKDQLAPVYDLAQKLPLPETERPRWAGYHGSAPVRTNNQAAEHVQNDAYGEMILSLSPIYLDQRFRHLRHAHHEKLLSHLGALAARSISTRDAGLWEIRDGWQEHTFTNLLCWAGLDRIRRIRGAGYLPSLGFDVDRELARAYQATMNGVKDGILQNGPEDASLDASLVIAPILRFPNQEVCAATVDAVSSGLRYGAQAPGSSYFYRYIRTDDFGTPNAPFLVCSFWVVQALAALGRKTEANRMLKHLGESANALGLFAEHYSPSTRKQLGNFPQAYSHVGMINAAFAVSPPWDEVI